MSGFASDWLALREPHDTASRSAGLARRLRRLLDGRPVIHALDLACGTGANARWLQPRLSRPQHWTLLDSDRALLGQATVPGAQTRSVMQDLTAGFGAIDPARFDLITTSAFLDLASERWLQALVAALSETSAALLFALTVDGRIAWQPEHPDDEALLKAFRRHQRSDKGFGPALGPDAPRAVEQMLGGRGYQVVGERSDWVLGPGDRDLQTALAEGQAAAAVNAQASLEGRARAWLECRRGWIDAAESRLRIGHRDLLAWRPADRSRTARPRPW